MLGKKYCLLGLRLTFAIDTHYTLMSMVIFDLSSSLVIQI